MSKEHWEHIYKTKNDLEVSWTQEIPKISLEYIFSACTDKKAKIIDIGGGNSKLVDFLLANDYEDITVLDISSTAIEKAKIRLGEKAEKVNWIVSDVLDFKPTRKYDLWHDRAAFHFLTTPTKIDYYINLVNEFVKKNIVMGTFSTKGPKKCSGLEICQYDEKKLSSLFKENFQLNASQVEDHKTPFDTFQHFLFCSFERK